MNRIKAFGVFWYDFIVGDDWKLAVGVIAGLSLSAVLVQEVGKSVWYALPVVVMLTLAVSLRFAVKQK